jgi:hypothetical protein
MVAFNVDVLEVVDKVLGVEIEFLSRMLSGGTRST